MSFLSQPETKAMSWLLEVRQERKLPLKSLHGGEKLKSSTQLTTMRR